MLWLCLKQFELFKSQVRYLGRLVTHEGVWIDPEDIEAFQHLKAKEPKNVEEVRALLGFLSYYRTGLFQDSKTPVQLMEGPSEPSQRATKVMSRTANSTQLSSKAPAHWTPGHQHCSLTLGGYVDQSTHFGLPRL